MTELLIMLMYCVWNWSKADIIYVVSKIGLRTITVQVIKCMDDTNPSRRMSVWIKLHTTGEYDKIMINASPEMLAAAAWIANEHETRANDDNYIQTLILVVCWEVFKGMRFVFWVLFTSSFDTMAKIEKMIEECRRVTYLAMKTCSWMVSAGIVHCFCCV